MRPIESYLEEVKKKAGIKTDYELAMKLGIKQPSLFHMKRGDINPSEETCKKLADLAGDPFEKVLLLLQVSKAPEVSRNAWEKILKLAIKGGLAMSLVYLWWAGQLYDMTTLPLLGGVIAPTANTGYYVKSKKTGFCFCFSKAYSC